MFEIFTYFTLAAAMTASKLRTMRIVNVKFIRKWEMGHGIEVLADLGIISSFDLPKINLFSD